MNKILIEDQSNDLHLKEDVVIIIKDQKCKINITTEDKISVFALVISSELKLDIKIKHDLTFNIFTVDTTTLVNIDLLNNDITLDYAYSTINKNDNKYQIDINHIGKNISSKIVNHGINTEKLLFIINTVVPKDSININTSQDSKIIVFEDKKSEIKPNLLIASDDIEANHSSYIGGFKDEKIFYLQTRGIEKKDAINLLVKSFLIGSMNINCEEKELILDILKKYWR